MNEDLHALAENQEKLLQAMEHLATLLGAPMRDIEEIRDLREEANKIKWNIRQDAPGTEINL